MFFRQISDHVARKKQCQMHTGIRWKIFKKRNLLEDLSIDGRIILIWNSQVPQNVIIFDKVRKRQLFKNINWIFRIGTYCQPRMIKQFYKLPSQITFFMDEHKTPSRSVRHASHRKVASSRNSIHVSNDVPYSAVYAKFWL